MADRRFDRRTFIGASVAGVALAGCKQTGEGSGQAVPDKLQAGNSSGIARPSKAKAQKTVVLGFDGVDPRLVERFIEQGALPNLERLASQGVFKPLASTSPPNSPVAWSTFATGRAPSEHGVFGFLKRNPKNYLPGTAPYTISPPRFHSGGLTPARAVSHRRGSAWWENLDRAGVSTSLLFVPYVFPPPNLRHGRVLSGLGTPDARFTNSSFTLYTSDASRAEGKSQVAGGRIVRLSVTGSKVATSLEGPRGPDKKSLAVPMNLELNRKAKSLTINLGGKTEILIEKHRSGWFPVRFEAPGFALAGRVRFHLLAVQEELELYASPIQLDPGQSALPLGAPADWVAKAVQTHSLPTVGWVHDTSAVNAGVLPKEVFLGAILDTMKARAGLLMDEVRAKRADILTAVFTGTDRAAHIFYRELEQDDGGPLRTVYQAMDKIVGQVRAELPADSRLVILSDHGFHPFEHMLHVNTWLEEKGWLTRRRAGGKVNFLRGIDWSATQAYSMGNGQLYANMKGREGEGSVNPGADREGLLAKVSAGLLDIKDPTSGQKPVRAVYPVADQAPSDLKERAPDLQIAFAPGWRNSWATTLGGAPSGPVFGKNPKAWCGDHAASDIAETPGILLADAPLSHPAPDLRDLANSLTRLAGQDPDGPGRVLWE